MENQFIFYSKRAYFGIGNLLCQHVIEAFSANHQGGKR